MSDKLFKALTLGPDARSSRGIFARGKNVYKGASTASNRGKAKPSIAAIRRRLNNGR